MVGYGLRHGVPDYTGDSVDLQLRGLERHRGSAAAGGEALGESRCDELGRQLLREGVRMHTFHLPFSASDDIASFYETRRKQAVHNMQRWMEKAAARFLGDW